MKRWHQFNDGHSPMYGHGTNEQAKRHLERLNESRAVNHYVAIPLDPSEEPRPTALVVDLDTGMTMPANSHFPWGRVTR